MEYITKFRNYLKDRKVAKTLVSVLGSGAMVVPTINMLNPPSVYAQESEIDMLNPIDMLKPIDMLNPLVAHAQEARSDYDSCMKQVDELIKDPKVSMYKIDMHIRVCKAIRDLTEGIEILKGVDESMNDFNKALKEWGDAILKK